MLWPGANLASPKLDVAVLAWLNLAFASSASSSLPLRFSRQQNLAVADLASPKKFQISRHQSSHHPNSNTLALALQSTKSPSVAGAALASPKNTILQLLHLDPRLTDQLPHDDCFSQVRCYVSQISFVSYLGSCNL